MCVVIVAIIVAKLRMLVETNQEVPFTLTPFFRLEMPHMMAVKENMTMADPDAMGETEEDAIARWWMPQRRRW